MKVLIIQQKMIGDVLTSSILFEAIKTKYPDYELHYLINSHTYPVVEDHPHVDEFKFFTPNIEKSKLALFAFAMHLRKENYDIVIDVYSKFSSNLFSLFSGAKARISKHKWYTSFLYTNTYKDAKTPKTNAGLAIENRLQLLSALNIPQENPIRPKIYLKETEKTYAKNALTANDIDLNKPLYMIGVLGSNPSKTYPFEYMATVIDGIIEQQPEAQILFNYIPKQEKDAKTIYKFCKASTQQHIYLNIYGKSLREFLAITSFCNAVIGNEGGAINMAKALNVPTFTIFSPWIDKSIWSVFDDGKTHVSVHLQDYKNEYYQNVKKYKILKTKTEAMYKVFSPIFFNTKFKSFLKILN